MWRNAFPKFEFRVRLQFTVTSHVPELIRTFGPVRFAVKSPHNWQGESRIFKMLGLSKIGFSGLWGRPTNQTKPLAKKLFVKKLIVIISKMDGKIVFQWIKSHVDISGNEEVDTLSKVILVFVTRLTLPPPLKILYIIEQKFGTLERT
ncbi:hypothetical protein CEXT_435701 [Caerostris extrusa]|uniref:RNase H type-1 domain-containing protein n=1 Tax=Caerostris extrusa TaxID=172846 RepID=A0AAV4QLR7_CAEEX|nr:hypothetical protein CEXT_435701 [Caerostris extrusa]